MVEFIHLPIVSITVVVGWNVWSYPPICLGFCYYGCNSDVIVSYWNHIVHKIVYLVIDFRKGSVCEVAVFAAFEITWVCPERLRILDSHIMVELGIGVSHHSRRRWLV